MYPAFNPVAAFGRFAYVFISTGAVCLSLSAAQAPSQQLQQTTPVPPDQLARISGRVVRADTSAPLPKTYVTLTLSTQSSQATTVRTDSGGNFVFPEVAPGTYRMRAQRNGFVAQSYIPRGSNTPGVLTLSAAQRLDKIEFRMEAAGVIAGTVTDEDGDPVENVSVFALRLQFNVGGRRQSFSTRNGRTDDAGDFRIPGLTPGYYFVQAPAGPSSIGGSMQVQPIAYSPTYYPGTTNLDEARRIQVLPGGVTRGINISAHSTQNYTINGVIVDSTPPSSKKQLAIGFVSTVGRMTMGVNQSDGSFHIPNIYPGDYTLLATANEEGGPGRVGYLSVRVTDSNLQVAIEIGRVSDVSGEVRLEDKSPLNLDGVRVRLAPETETGVPFETAMESGAQFIARNVAAGKYFVQIDGRETEIFLKEAHCNGEDAKIKPLTVSAGENIRGCELILSRDVSLVSGQIAQDDKPSTGLIVVLIPQEMDLRKISRHTMTTRSDPNGQFQIKGVIPGDYFAYAVEPSDDNAYYDLEFPERNRNFAERVTVKPKEPLVLTLKPTKPL